MRKLFKILPLLILLPVLLSAQKSKVWNKPLYDAYPYHFGFSFSTGVLDFSVAHDIQFNQFDSVYSVEGSAKPIFGASIVGVLKLNENLDLRFLPGLSFGQRDLKYLYKYTEGEDTVFTSHTMKIESTHLQFPLLIKYRSTRENNYRPYIIAGTNYTIDLASQKKIKESEKPKIRLKRHDILLEAGFGVDYYLPFFKFSTELKFSYGLLNMVNYDQTEFTRAYESLGTKMVTFSIYFE